MSELGNLSKFLEDEDQSLPDLDWMRIDQEAYREESEVLPKQNLDAIPDLKAKWKERSEADKYNLSPTNQPLEQVDQEKQTPFWSETGYSPGMSDREKKEIVDHFIKRNLTAGKGKREVFDLLKKNFDKGTLRTAENQIRSGLKKDGLLGTVYVDARMFPDCDQGEGQDFIDKHADRAKFVIGKKKCHDCQYNQGGVCSRFEKEILFDVDSVEEEIDESLWEEYREEFEAENRDLSDIDASLSPKEKIRQASKADEKEFGSPVRDKPVQPKPVDRVSSEEADEIVSEMDNKQEVIDNVYRKSKVRKTARTLMARDPEEPAPDHLQDKIENDPDLAELDGREHLLGSLYLDLSYFEDARQASSFIDEHGIDPDEYVIVSTPSEGDSPLDRESKTHLDLEDPDILNKIVQRYALTTYGPDKMASNVEPILKTSEKMTRMSRDQILRFANAVYAQPIPQSHRQYEKLSPEIWRDNHDTVGYREAKREFKRVEAGEVKSPQDRKTREVISRRMMKGHHGSDMESRIRESDLDMDKHRHLLGKLYRDDSVFSTEEEKNAFYRKHSHLLELPDYSDEEDFWYQERVQDHILHRCSKVIEDDSDLNRVRSNLSSMEAEDIRSVARTVFAADVPEEDRYYNPGHPIVEDRPRHVDSSSIKTVKKALESPDLREAVLESEESRERAILELGKIAGLQNVKRAFIEHEDEEISSLLDEGTLRDMEVFSHTVPDEDSESYDPNRPIVEDRPEHVGEASVRASGDEDWEDRNQPGLRTIIAHSDQDKDRILKFLGKRVGYQRLKRVFLDHGDKKTADLLEDDDLRDDVQSVLKTVASGSFNPEGGHIPPRPVIRSKTGQWLRDRLVEGEHGEKLSKSLRDAFSYREILENAPTISLMREEEGLYGRVYVTADSYDSCHEGSEKVASTVDQIVARNGRCQCGTEIGDVCPTYQRKVVAAPNYKQEHVRQAAAWRMNKGDFTERQAREMAQSDFRSVKDHIQSVWLHRPDPSATSEKEVTKEAFHIQEESPSASKTEVDQMLRFAREKAEDGWPRKQVKNAIENHFGPEVVYRASSELAEILSECKQGVDFEVVDHDSSDAPSGRDALEEFGLVSSSDGGDGNDQYELSSEPDEANNPVDDAFDFSDEDSDDLDIEIGNGSFGL